MCGFCNLEFIDIWYYIEDIRFIIKIRLFIVLFLFIIIIKYGNWLKNINEIKIYESYGLREGV